MNEHELRGECRRRPVREGGWPRPAGSRAIPAGFALLALSILTGGEPADAQDRSAAAGVPPGATLVESVVAVVGNEPILRSEVEAQLEMAIYSMGLDRSDQARVAEIREQIIEQQIDQLVLYQEARLQEIPVNQDEVVRAVDEAILRNKQEIGSDEQFQRQLQLEGLSEDDLRERYLRQARLEMMVGRLMQRDLGGEIPLSEEEVRAYFEEHRGDFPKRDTALHLQHIIIAVRPDSVLVDKARTLALDVADQIRTGTLGFVEAAKRYSDDPNGRTGGDLRRIRRGDLIDGMGREFEESLFRLDEGGLSEPLPSPLGFHLVRMNEKDPAGEWVHPSHILFRVPVVQADVARAEDRAQKVYERALAGEPFDALARAHSDEPESAARGGDVGWVPLSSMTGQAAERLPHLGPGEIAAPMAADGFFHLFRLVERDAEREFSFEEVADELADLVQAQKREQRYAEWVAEIKRRHHIKRFPWGEN
jgi:peptidyl-prolyl cis-trans isomerase SurA